MNYDGMILLEDGRRKLVMFPSKIVLSDEVSRSSNAKNVLLTEYTNANTDGKPAVLRLVVC